MVACLLLKVVQSALLKHPKVLPLAVSQSRSSVFLVSPSAAVRVLVTLPFAKATPPENVVVAVLIHPRFALYPRACPGTPVNRELVVVAMVSAEGELPS